MSLQSLHELGMNVCLYGVIALWVALALRTPGARRSRPQRRLLIAAAGLAGSITVYLDPVTALLNRTYLFGASCGITVNIWGVLSSAFILDFVLAAVARRSPWLIYGTSVLVSGVLLALNTGPVPQAGCVTSIAVPWYSPFWWLLSLAHVVAVGPCAVLCARYASQATSRSLRVGLWLLAAGFISSTVFWSLVVLGYLTTRWAWLGAFFPLNIGITAWLMSIGVALPLVVRAQRWWRNQRALGRLAPLWRDLVAAAPHVRLPKSRSRHWSIDLRLYRRIIEIRDALLILRDYVGQDTVDAARAHVQAADLPAGADVEALATACWLAVAERAKAGGVPPRPAGRTPTEEPAEPGDEWTNEFAFLDELTQARRAPIVADFARQRIDQVAGDPAAQPNPTATPVQGGTP
jgi:hypothetical protein